MSNSIKDLVLEFSGAGGTADERIDTLTLRGRFSSAAVQEAWLDMCRAPPAPLTQLQVYDVDIGGDVGVGDAFDPDRLVNLTIVKPTVAGVAVFFFEAEAAKFLTGKINVAELRVAELADRSEFTARGLDVSPWRLEDAISTRELPDPVSPGKLVADHVPDRAIPKDLSPWILLAAPARPSALFRRWRTIAATRLLSGLVSSAFLEDGELRFQASGPPIYQIAPNDPSVAASWEGLTEAVGWVYLSGSDVEARHRLFASELARAGRPGQEFRTTLERALEAARVAYEAHVQSSSRETLKALAELRKTVVEETQKVSQRAQDMTVALGKDLAVSAAPFILKLFADAGKVTAPAIAAAFYFVAAIYVAVSFGLQWRINSAFLRSQRQSRARWLSTLASYISTKEREEIADQPIEDAIKNYRETRGVLLLVYVALALALAGAGIYTLRHDPALPNSGAAAGHVVPNASPGAPLRRSGRWGERPNFRSRKAYRPLKHRWPHAREGQARKGWVSGASQ